MADPTTEPWNIQIVLEGQLLARYIDGRYAQIHVPDFGDDHFLQIKVVDFATGKTLRNAQGPLSHDIWFQVDDPGDQRFCFYVSDSTIDIPTLQANPTNPAYVHDIRWVADFQRSDYHNGQLQYDLSNMKRSVFLEAGHFFTLERNKCPAVRKKGNPGCPGATSESYTIATKIGANISLRSGQARILKDDGTPLFPALPGTPAGTGSFEFTNPGKYQVIIKNMPPVDYTESIGDFAHYYRVIRGIPHGERYDFEFNCPDLNKVSGLRVKSEDVPCLPGGGGLP